MNRLETPASLEPHDLPLRVRRSSTIFVATN
jgi:hypothetical protein